MLDLISKRRYGYLLSGVLVITGLIFIVATLIPNGGVGLQFSIAYTGGTVWEVHFEDGTPQPNEVRAVLEEVGLDGEVAITTADDIEYVLIRTEELALQAPEVVEGSAAAAVAEQAAASASADPGTTAEATESAAVASEAPAETETPTATETPAESIAPEGSATPAESIAADESAAPVETETPDASASPVPAAAVPPGSDDEGGSAVQVPTEGRFGELAAALQAQFGPIDEVRQENSVGPVVSQELVWQTLLLVLMAAAAIMAWVGYRFRDFRMGVAALAALLHDVIIVVGAFALMGTFIELQIDGLFVTAMLTVIGYSVHDTIVVFDRIRENRQRFYGEPLESIVNHSMAQTIGRSITTSLTLIVTMAALLLFGGEAIRPFILALLIGVISGTYSSIFVASPLFLDWHLWADRRKASQPVEAKAERSAA
jgi:preprotein translocase SecF subunit